MTMVDIMFLSCFKRKTRPRSCSCSCRPTKGTFPGLRSVQILATCDCDLAYIVRRGYSHHVKNKQNLLLVEHKSADTLHVGNEHNKFEELNLPHSDEKLVKIDVKSDQECSNTDRDSGICDAQSNKLNNDFLCEENDFQPSNDLVLDNTIDFESFEGETVDNADGTIQEKQHSEYEGVETEKLSAKQSCLEVIKQDNLLEMPTKPKTFIRGWNSFKEIGRRSITVLLRRATSDRQDRTSKHCSSGIKPCTSTELTFKTSSEKNLPQKLCLRSVTGDNKFTLDTQGGKSSSECLQDQEKPGISALRLSSNEIPVIIVDDIDQDAEDKCDNNRNGLSPLSVNNETFLSPEEESSTEVSKINMNSNNIHLFRCLFITCYIKYAESNNIGLVAAISKK